MRSLVVRVYPMSGDRDEGGAVAGIVEDPETGRQVAFHDAQELWAAINGAAPSRRRRPDAGSDDGSCKPSER